MAITIKTSDEVAIIRRAGGMLAEILNACGAAAAPGMSTADIDQIARDLCDQRGVTPGFLGYHGFSGAMCTSVNDQVVHCIPSKEKILQDGDILKLDFGVAIDGWNSDACQTFAIGTISPAAEKLMKVTKESMYKGIDQAIIGNRIGDIGHAVERHVTPHGYSPVRECVGHGIGRRLHEDPEIPNWGSPGTGPKIVAGMVICIEPIINIGTHKIITEADRWTTRTADGELSAHFEHTIYITPDGPEILTPWE